MKKEKVVINKPRIKQLDEKQAAILYDEMARNFWPIVGTANHMAMTSMFDSYDLLESQGLLRFDIKKYMNNAARVYDKYLLRVRRELKDRFPLWSDVTRIIASKIQPQADELRHAIEKFFENNGVDNTELRAQVCATDAMIQNSCAIFDTYIEHYQKMTEIDISSGFRMARMTGVQNFFRQVARKLLKTDLPHNINVNHDVDCYTALENLLSRFRDIETINEACHQALVLNPEMKKYARPEDHHVFEK